MPIFLAMTKIWRKELGLITLCLFFRIILLMITCTSYVPDEYYQYQELVSKILFGQGIVTWEWFISSRIRSFVPLLPSLLLGQMSVYLGMGFISVAFISRLFHTVLALVSDYCFINIVRLLKIEFSTQAVLVNLFSWSGLYMVNRSLANSLEYSCLLIGSSALVQFVCCRDCFSFFIGLVAVACSTYIRPTAALYWVPLFMQLLWHYKDLFTDIRFLMQVIAVVISIILGCMVIDSMFYGEFTIAPINFFIINVVEKKAVYFGVKPWHFTLTEGLPVVLGLYFPTVLLVFALGRQAVNKLSGILLTSAVSYVVLLGAVSSHQEHRFLLPIIPYFHLALVSCAIYLTKVNKKFGALVQVYLYLAAIVHIAFATYLLTFHQRGGETMMQLLKTKYTSVSGQKTHVVLHAPCYSFPGYAHLLPSHSSFELYTPECFMPWEDKSLKDDQGEYNHILSIAHEHRLTDEELYVVTFDSFYNFTSYNEYGFEMVENITHAHFDFDLDESRPMLRVLLYRFVR